MTTIEHNIPVPVLYDDILMLYVKSGTGATPTHIVDYGGVFGEVSGLSLLSFVALTSSSLSNMSGQITTCRMTKSA